MFKEKKYNIDEGQMPSVLLEKNYKELCSVIASESNEDMIEDFFSCLFTPAERKAFAERWLLVKEINSGTPQREIAKKFNMSLCKITRGSRELQKENSAFKKFIERYSAIKD